MARRTGDARRRRRDIAGLLVLGSLFGPAAAAAGEPASLDIDGKSYAIHVFGGRNFDENFTDFFAGFGDGRYNDAHMAGAAVSKRLFSWRRFAIEVETGIARHFGDFDATEIWGAAYLRYHAFPWNKYLYTTVAASTGLSYLTDVPDAERRKNHGRASSFLHYFSPEITFALPDHKDMELVFRLHHRSGVGGLFNGVEDATNVPTVGFRLRF